MSAKATDLARIQEMFDLTKWHIQRPQIPDGVQGFKLPGAVVAIACARRDILRRQQPHILVVAQAADAQVEELGHVADLKQLGLIHGSVLPPVSVFRDE